jgi:hypothetical protein
MSCEHGYDDGMERSFEDDVYDQLHVQHGDGAPEWIIFVMILQQKKGAQVPSRFTQGLRMLR